MLKLKAVVALGVAEQRGGRCAGSEGREPCPSRACFEAPSPGVFVGEAPACSWVKPRGVAGSEGPGGQVCPRQQAGGAPSLRCRRAGPCPGFGGRWVGRLGGGGGPGPGRAAAALPLLPRVLTLTGWVSGTPAWHRVGRPFHVPPPAPPPEAWGRSVPE